MIQVVFVSQLVNGTGDWVVGVIAQVITWDFGVMVRGAGIKTRHGHWCINVMDWALELYRRRWHILSWKMKLDWATLNWASLNYWVEYRSNAILFWAYNRCLVNCL